MLLMFDQSFSSISVVARSKEAPKSPWHAGAKQGCLLLFQPSGHESVSAPSAGHHHQPPLSTSLHYISFVFEFCFLPGPSDGLVVVTNLTIFLLLLAYAYQQLGTS